MGTCDLRTAVACLDNPDGADGVILCWDKSASNNGTINTLIQQMSFDDGIDTALANGDDAFNEPFSATKYSTDQFSDGTQSAKFECTIADHGFGRWGAIHNLTSSTGTGYLVDNGAGYNIGDTVITIGTGSGTITAANAIVQFAGDSTLYALTASTATSVTLAGTGLTQSLADTTAMTIVNKWLTYGETLIYAYDSYLPAAASIFADPGWLKTLRFKVTGTVNGYMDLAEQPDGAFQLFSEVGGEPTVTSATGVRVRDTQQRIKLKVFFHNTTGYIKLYFGDVLKAESLNINTMNNAADYCTAIYMGTNWNGGPPLTLSGITGGTPTAGDQLSSDDLNGTAGPNFGYIRKLYDSTHFELEDPAHALEFISGLAAGDTVTNGVWSGVVVKTSEVYYVDNIEIRKA